MHVKVVAPTSASFPVYRSRHHLNVRYNEALLVFYYVHIEALSVLSSNHLALPSKIQQIVVHVRLIVPWLVSRT